jgi:hypothetical protein
MDTYEKLIKKHYESLSSEELDNGSIEHAKILVKYLFELALAKQKDVKIISGCLNGAFYNTFADYAKNILNNGNSISLISIKKPEAGSFKNTLEHSDNASIVVADSKVDSLPHFILVGDSAYRFENDDILCTAKASFNKPSMGKFLNFLFDDIHKRLNA